MIRFSRLFQAASYAAMLGLSLYFPSIAKAQSVGEGITVTNVNDWGSGFNATFEYTITTDDVSDDKVRDWRIEIDYTGAAHINNAYMTGYSGSVSTGNIAPDGGYAITNEGVGYRPELDSGFKLIFTLGGQGSGFNAEEFAIEFVNLTELPTNEFQSSLVNVNDWYNPNWGGGFNATYRCDILGPDAAIGPVTDLLIEFNYTGSGTPTTAWTQSHNGPIEYGFIAPDGGYAIENLDGFQPELYAGDSITFAVQVQNAGFVETDFNVQCSSGGTTDSNAAPVALSQSQTVESGQPLDLQLQGSDPDGDALNFSITQGPQHGVLTGTPPALVYISTPGFSGLDTFLFSVSDGALDAPGSVEITVSTPVAIPTAIGFSVQGVEDGSIPLTLEGSGGNGTALSYVVVSAPQHGELTGQAPDLLYTPNADFFGEDEFTFQVSDGVSTSDLATVALSISAINDAPVAVEQSVTVDEDGAKALTLEGSDVDGDALTMAIVNPPGQGTLSGALPDLVYTPIGDFNGSDSFSFTVSDGTATSAETVITISVAAVNDRPVATGQSLSVVEDTPINIILSSTDVDGDAVSYQLVELPQFGQIDGTAPTLTYSPDPDFNGADSFSFVVNDGMVDSVVADVLINVTDTNDVPVAQEQAVVTDEDTSIDVVLVGTDSDSDALMYALSREPLNGQLEGSAPHFNYTPAPDFTGMDSFAFTVTDGTATSAEGQVSITVNPVNDAPVGVGQIVTTNENTPLTILLTGTDQEGDELTVAIVQAPQFGVLSGELPTVVYTPDAGFSGSDSFIFSVSDGELTSTADITIDVLNVNALPIITSTAPLNALIGERYTYTVVASDADNDVLSYALEDAPTGMTIESSSGTVEWTPTELETVSFRIVVTDTDGGKAEQLVTLVVTPVNAPLSYLGKEFWLTFNDNLGGVINVEPVISVTSIPGANGVIRVPSIALEIPFSVSAGGVYTHVFTPEQAEAIVVYPARQRENKALHISTDNDVAVYALNRQEFTSDAALIHPVRSLGRHYTVASYNNFEPTAHSRRGSAYSIVAVEDNTQVTLTPRYDHYDTTIRSLITADHPLTFTLDQGETYATQTSGNEYRHAGTTGTQLTSDKPLAVFVGHECAHVPSGTQACDHLVEQLVPQKSWGTRYLSAPLATRKRGDTFRLYAAENNTIFKVNGAVLGMLNRGESLDTVIEGPAEFTANHPIAVAQLSNSAFWDKEVRDTPEDFADPFMVLLPAAEQFLSEYVFTTPSADISAHYINVVITERDRQSVVLDGVAIASSSFSNIGDTDFVYAQLPITAGSHQINANEPFGLIVYGYDEFESYGYVAGQSFGSDAVPSTLQISGLASQEISDNACFEVTLQASDGSGIPATQIVATVTGANNNQQTLLTNRFGRADLCISSTTAGVDTITVRHAVLTNSQALEWTRDANINHAPIVTSIPVAKTRSGDLFTYTLSAIDPDGDAVTFSLLSSPDGASLISGNQLQWPAAAAGAYAFEVAVSDGDLSTEQSIRLQVVRDILQVPTILSESPTKLSHKNVFGYYYRPIATQDQFGFTVTESALRSFVETAPSGYQYTPTIRGFSWNPSEQDVGDNDVVIGVSDYGGRVAYQAFTVEVTDTEPPVFTDLPPTSVYVGETLAFTVVATDADGDPLSYGFKNFSTAASSPPPGMSIDENTGLLTYTPGTDSSNIYFFHLSAEDVNGGQISRPTSISVLRRPEITSSPVLFAQEGTEYLYDVDATNPVAATFQFSLIASPVGMTINATTGIISWTPTAAQVGSVPVTVQVQNSQGGTIEQSFTIAVTGLVVANNPPEFTSTPLTSAEVGVEYQYQVMATDADGDTLSFSLSNAPQGMVIEASSGLITWTPEADDQGEVNVTLSVNDGIVSVNQVFTVAVRADETPPRVDIQNPDQLTEITAPVDIMGTITDPNLRDWRLIAQRKGTEEIIELATGTVEKEAEFLGTFDPTMQINGLYSIAVQAFDNAGNETLDGVTVLVDGDLKVGNFSITFADLSIPMLGIPIEVTRTYDSRRRAENKDFGYGWTIDYQNVDVTESRTPGRAWELNEYGSILFGEPVEFCVEPIGTPLVSVRLPDGTLETFDIEASPRCSSLPVLDVELSFKAKDGTTSELIALNSKRGRLDQTFGELAVLGGDTLDPSVYQLTTKAGYIYRLNQDLGIETVTDPNGHVITYSDAGISHSAGKSIDFVRNAGGQITEIADPAGNLITYEYDANGDLINVIDRAFAKTDFTYNTNHGLVDIIDPLGNRIVRTIYDDDGRMIAQEDNLGNRTEFSHNLSGRESIVTDRLGRTTFLYYDDRGNVTSKVDALGQTYGYSFDQYDNQLTETNSLGHTTSATFDDRYNQLSQSDALGNTVTYAYNARGQETSIVDARGNTYTNVYDGAGNLLTVTDPLGHIAGQSINSQGLAFLRRDAEGNDTLFEYDDEGNVTKETDAEGGVTTYTYDTNNNRLSESRVRTVNGIAVTDTTSYEYNSRDQLIKTTDALGNVTQTEYDPLGRETAQIDAKGRRTSMAYDSYGRLTETTYPDGTTDTSTYDVEGNKLTDTDRLGHTTTYTYDALNRSISTTFVDGVSISSVYDSAGRMVSETDERDNTRTYTYDAADRRISGTDALGNTMSFSFDADGNMTQETDARGNATRYSYNALDQRVETTFADNTTMSSGYDKRGLEISKTDQNGRTTEYGYDGLSRLVSVTDALGQITRYGYDEVGNKLTQTDALDRETRWAYDAINRPISRTLPLGQQETYVYDAVGNRTSHTDFNGATHTFTYDSNNDWLSNENWADGNSTTYAYNAIGQRTSATDSNGTFTYSYDNRDRLVQEEKHDGSVLLYGYDETGNRINLSTVVAGVTSTTSYTFDELNRLSSVADTNGQATTYDYDANSNQTRIDQANGTATVNTFDALNRITTITHLGTADELLAELSYTLDPTGRRTAIDESSGRSSSYSYDDLYRLTGEAIIDGDNGNHNATYQYDAVSNRIQETVNGVQLNSAYDDNDRLTAHGADSYSYDDNGNTVSEIVAGQSNSYNYNSRNRLVEAVKDGVVQTMVYDPDNARIQKTTDGAVTDYLVDANRDYAQVLYERSSTTELSYTFGIDLVGLDTGVEQYTYHSDALGSTRVLTDSTGQVADDIRYDAWGEKLSGGDVVENQYLYTGEQFDSGLGKVYLRARYYDVGVGRFSQHDAFDGFTDNPVSLNKYLYANGEPSNNTDPSGYFSLSSLGTSSNIQSILNRSSVPVFRAQFNQALAGTLRASGGPVRGGGKMVVKFLKRCVKKKDRCGIEFNLLIVGRDSPESARFIRGVQTARTIVLTYQKRKAGNRRWYRTKRGQKWGCTGKRPSTKSCDEYPYFKTREGGAYKFGVRTRWINAFENSRVGGFFGFLASRMDDNDEFVVITSNELPTVALPLAGKK